MKVEEDFKVIDQYLCICMPQEIDHHNAGSISRMADKMICTENVSNIIFDFSRTEFMDSSGIGILVGRYKKITCFGGKVYAIHTGQQIRKIIHMGKKEIREVLVEKNLGLVRHIVKRFLGRGVDGEDLFQIGSIGLMKAIDKFDLSYDVKFSTYAVPMISGEIKRFLRDDGMVKVSRTLKENGMHVRRAIDQFSLSSGREPTMEEIGQITGMAQEDIVMALESGCEVESIYRSVYQSDGNEIYLVDQVVGNSGKSALGEAVHSPEDLEKDVEVEQNTVLLKDICKMYCNNDNIVNKRKTLKVGQLDEKKASKKVISVIKIIEMIGKEYPDIAVESIGETDTLIEKITVLTSENWQQTCKIIFVAMVSFFGTAFTIMAFHNDIGIEMLFSKFHELVMGEASNGHSVLEISYSIGLAAGIIIFFNHIGGRRITKDPTPIEVEMRMYERDVNDTLIETAEREGKEIEVS